MSTGAGIGGIFGAILGIAASFIPGVNIAVWTAATIGFTIGGAIGSYISPVSTSTPDTPVVGSPSTDPGEFTTCEEGIPVPDVFGTTSLPGNIFGYWNNRNEPIKKTSVSTPAASSSKGKGGGGGGSTTTESIVGYKYFLTWAVGLCEGPIEAVHAIYKDNDKCIWKGTANAPNSSGYQEIVVTDVGTVRIYFGTTTQQVDPLMGSYIDAYAGFSDACPAYRKFAYALFVDCYLGEYNRGFVTKFVVTKRNAVWGTGVDNIGTYDYNPAAMLSNIFYDTLEIPESMIDTSFYTVAQTLVTEAFGLGLQIGSYQSAQTYIESILNHIDGYIYFNSSGKFVLALLRADKTVAEMSVIEESYLLEPPTFTKKTWLNTTSEIKVQYPKRMNDSN